jgi:hypothetical protein
MIAQGRGPDGLFEFHVYDLNNRLYARGQGYPCHKECERTAQIYNRDAVLYRKEAQGEPIQVDYMTPRQLAAEYVAMLQEVDT